MIPHFIIFFKLTSAKESVLRFPASSLTRFHTYALPRFYSTGVTTAITTSFIPLSAVKP
jgi:hypothetical protein